MEGGIRPQVHLSELASVVQLVKLASGECPLVSLPLCVSLARASFGRRAERVASRCACFAASAHERLCDARPPDPEMGRHSASARTKRVLCVQL